MTERGKTRLLIVSLVFNALLLGFLLGQLRGEAFERAALRRAQDISSAETPLDTVVTAAFDTERGALNDALRDTRQAQDDAAAIVRSDPLDLDRLDQALGRVRAGDTALLTATHRALRSAAAKLDPQNRDAVADVIANSPPAGSRFEQRYRWSYLRRLLD